MRMRRRRGWCCVLAGLLLCGCGTRQPAWDAALRQAVCTGAQDAAGTVPEGEWASLKSRLPALLEQAADSETGAYLREAAWERRGSQFTLRLLYDAAPQEILRQQRTLSAYTARWAAQYRMLPPEVCVLLAHDAVIRGCTFSDGAGSNTAYGALLRGKARCGGYAAAFRALCTAAGIPCITVRGTVQNAGEPVLHAWNLVQLGGLWYHTDCTWDAGAFVPRHTWFLRCDAEMSETHAWDRRSIPAAAGGTLSYRAIVQTMRDM